MKSGANLIRIFLEPPGVGRKLVAAGPFSKDIPHHSFQPYKKAYKHLNIPPNQHSSHGSLNLQSSLDTWAGMGR